MVCRGCCTGGRMAGDYDKKGRGKMATINRGGRPRIYKSVAAFRRAVDGYFASITHERKLTEWEDTGERTNRGKPVLRERDVLGPDGEPVWLLEYIVPPTMPALQLAIGVSKSSWDNYRHRDGYAQVCEDAKLRIEAYLAEQVVIQKNPSGVIFTLENNYGWRSRREVELGEATRGAISAMDMTMADKLALIREAARDADEGS